MGVMHKPKTAFVGASMPITPQDWRCVVAAYEIMDERWPGCQKTGDDFINLDDGRDFLTEATTYDVVVLFCIYLPPDNGIWETDVIKSQTNQAYEMSPRCGTAYDTAIGAWVDRLISTGARLIIPMALTTCCLEAWQLPLAGYETHCIQTKKAFVEYLEMFP